MPGGNLRAEVASRRAWPATPLLCTKYLSRGGPSEVPSAKCASIPSVNGVASPLRHSVPGQTAVVARNLHLLWWGRIATAYFDHVAAGT